MSSCIEGHPSELALFELTAAMSHWSSCWHCINLTNTQISSILNLNSTCQVQECCKNITRVFTRTCFADTGVFPSHAAYTQLLQPIMYDLDLHLTNVNAEYLSCLEQLSYFCTLGITANAYSISIVSFTSNKTFLLVSSPSF